MPVISPSSGANSSDIRWIFGSELIEVKCRL
jgi:hypothetical protein